MVALPSTLLTRQQTLVAVAVGLVVAWLQTASLAAAVGYALGAVPLALLAAVAVVRLAGDGSTDAADA